MAVKEFSLDAVGTVFVYKRRGAKNIRLSVNSDGKVRVTIPPWLPYKAGLAFAEKKSAWLVAQKPQEGFTDGQRLGKFHTLHIESRKELARIQTRVTDTEAFVLYPHGTPALQIDEAAHKVAKRVMKTEADRLLPQRLDQLAEKFGFSYASVSIRHLKSRWGSCNSKKALVFNYYLMQVPWEEIDYVIIHELSHTKHLNHGTDFWSEVERCLPDYKQRRKVLNEFQPSILAPKSMRSMA
jgi:predicted metal-dependent hydrolase